MLRRILLILVLAALPASAQAERSLESMVQKADAVAEAQVEVRQGRDQGAVYRYPVLVVLDALEGEPPDEVPLVVSETFEPPVGEPAIWFLARGPRGWVPLGPQPFRPLEEEAWIRALLAARPNPRQHLQEAGGLRLRAALALLRPREEDRLRLVGLLEHAEWPVRLAAAEALGRLDPAAAMAWLLKSWPVEDPYRYFEVQNVVARLLKRDLRLPLDSASDRRRAVEVHRLAWDLRGPDRSRAEARLPELKTRAATEPGPWVVESLALFPADRALEGLAESLRNTDEGVVGRALELLRRALQKPDAATRKALAGPPGDLVRARLQGLARRSWSDPAVGRAVAAESRDLLGRLRSLQNGKDPSSSSP